eukprot:403345881
MDQRDENQMKASRPPRDNLTSTTEEGSISAAGFFNQEDGLFYENPNPDFTAWNFHYQDTSEEPQQFTYSTTIENLRITLNTYMKKALKTPFQANFKKAVIQVNRQNDCETQSFDDYMRSQLLLKTQQDLPEEEINFQHLLNNEADKFLGRRFITKKRNNWLAANQIEQFHKSKAQRKLAKIYYHINHDEIFENNGKVPLFVVSNKPVYPLRAKEQIKNNGVSEIAASNRKQKEKAIRKKFKKRVTIVNSDQLVSESNSPQTKSPYQVSLAAMIKSAQKSSGFQPSNLKESATPKQSQNNLSNPKTQPSSQFFDEDSTQSPKISSQDLTIVKLHKQHIKNDSLRCGLLSNQSMPLIHQNTHFKQNYTPQLIKRIESSYGGTQYIHQNLTPEIITKNNQLNQTSNPSTEKLKKHPNSQIMQNSKASDLKFQGICQFDENGESNHRLQTQSSTSQILSPNHLKSIQAGSTQNILKNDGSNFKIQRSNKQLEIFNDKEKKRQHPMVKFDNNNPLLKLDPLLLSSGSQKDTRLFEMLNQLYLRNQHEKCQLFQQYYMNKLVEKQENNKKLLEQSQLLQKQSTPSRSIKQLQFSSNSNIATAQITQQQVQKSQVPSQNSTMSEFAKSMQQSKNIQDVRQTVNMSKIANIGFTNGGVQVIIGFNQDDNYIPNKKRQSVDQQQSQLSTANQNAIRNTQNSQQFMDKRLKQAEVHLKQATTIDDTKDNCLPYITSQQQQNTINPADFKNHRRNSKNSKTSSCTQVMLNHRLQSQQVYQQTPNNNHRYSNQNSMQTMILQAHLHQNSNSIVNDKTQELFGKQQQQTQLMELLRNQQHQYQGQKSIGNISMNKNILNSKQQHFEKIKNQ